MLGSLGHLTVELLRPVDVHAQSCTLDPLGGEVCLPDDTPPKDSTPPKGPNGGDDHAALIELGLDYTTYNVHGTSVGVYARGGALVWGGDRGTSWQVQGGLSFRF